jgi:ferredoxin
VVACGWGGARVKGVASRVHETVRLAERIYLEDSGEAEGTTDASEAFRATGRQVQELYDEASGIIGRFGLGGWLCGGFLGFIVGLKLIGLSVWRRRSDYEAERASCVACGRCYEYCPREQVRLKKIGQVT